MISGPRIRGVGYGGIRAGLRVEHVKWLFQRLWRGGSGDGDGDFGRRRGGRVGILFLRLFLGVCWGSLGSFADRLLGWWFFDLPICLFF